MRLHRIVSVFRHCSPRQAGLFFFCTAGLYLLACLIPRPWERPLITSESLRHSSHVFELQGGRWEPEHLKLEALPAQTQATLTLPLWTTLTSFHQVRLQGSWQGTGDLCLEFTSEKYQCASAFLDPQTHTFDFTIPVVQDADPVLKIFAHSSEGQVTELRLQTLELKGLGERSYGKWVLPFFWISFFVWLGFWEKNARWAQWGTLAVLFLLLIAPRLSYLLYLEETPFSDMADYQTIALNLLAGKTDGHHPFFQSFYAHGLSYYVAAVYWLFGVKNWLALRLCNLGLAVILGLLLYGTGKKLVGARAGLMALALLAFSQEMVFWAGKLSTEHLFAVTLGGALYALVQAWQKRSWVWSLGAGLLLGYAFFIRSVLQFVFLGLFVGIWGGHPAPKKQKLALLVVACLGFLLVLTPWMVRGYERYGRLLLTGTGGWFSFVHQNNATVLPGEFGGREHQDYYQREAPRRFANDALAADWVKQEALSWVKENWKRYLVLCLGRIKMLFWHNGDSLTKVHMTEFAFFPGSYFNLLSWNLQQPLSLGWLTLVAFGLTGWKTWQERRITREVLVLRVLPWLFFWGLSGFYWATLSFPRYRDPLLPLAYLGIGVAVELFYQSWKVSSLGGNKSPQSRKP